MNDLTEFNSELNTLKQLLENNLNHINLNLDYLFNISRVLQNNQADLLFLNQNQNLVFSIFQKFCLNLIPFIQSLNIKELYVSSMLSLDRNDNEIYIDFLITLTFNQYQYDLVNNIIIYKKQKPIVKNSVFITNPISNFIKIFIVEKQPLKSYNPFRYLSSISF